MSKKQGLILLLWIFVGLLLVWAWRDVSFSDLMRALTRLNPASLGLLLLINAAILLLFGSRWWLILRALGYPLSYLTLAKYRLASFGISYFTPGPQFGGEPMQVYWLHTYHAIPTKTALASVSLDKLFEMLANFTFLAGAILIVVWEGLFLQTMSGTVIAFSGGMLVLLLGYSLALWIGRTPLAWTFGRIPFNERKHASLSTFRQTLLDAEFQMGQFFRQHPHIILLSSIFSGMIWLSLLGEYALALRFLGLETSWLNILAIIVFARLAFLTPLPAGLGALEAGQVFAMQSLGLDPIFGVSISLFIRVRDSFFGLLGLWIGSRVSQRKIIYGEKYV